MLVGRATLSLRLWVESFFVSSWPPGHWQSLTSSCMLCLLSVSTLSSLSVSEFLCSYKDSSPMDEVRLHLDHFRKDAVFRYGPLHRAGLLGLQCPWRWGMYGSP